MIRLAYAEDEAALMSVAKSIELFEPEELEMVREMFTHDCDEGDEAESLWLVDEVDGNTVSAAYCAPERMTNGTWNLLFIGVLPVHQGKGFGSAMVRYVEQLLTGKGASLLLVETLADFERTRAFYRRCGYEEEATIRDYYEVGADKVIYRKALNR
ncbi:MAG: GNAT family N-acetyltransferase [Cyanobacteria bacterium P01_D01_bin.36]